MSICINRKKLIFFISVYTIIYNFKRFINCVYTLRVLIFACIYFCELKKNRISRVLIFGMASFWKFWVYKFLPQGKKPKKNPVESRKIRLMFLSRSTERQAGRDGKTVVIDWFLKKSWINKKFLCIFLWIYFLRNINFLHIWCVFIFVNVF